MIAAIILAGSHAWSSDDLSMIGPRLLLPVANVPMVEHILAWLRDAAVQRVVFCHNDSDANLWEQLGIGTSQGFEFYYCVDREPRGPAGCCRDASFLVKAARYIVMDGSVLPDFSLADALARHMDSRAVATVVVTRESQVRPAEEQWSPAGVYIFEARVLASIPSTGFQDIKEMLLPRLHDQGEPVRTYATKRPCPRLSGMEACFMVQAWMLRRMWAGEVATPGYFRANGTFQHATAVLNAGAEIVGPVMLGPGSRIERGAAVIGPTVIGRDCVVQRDCVLQRSILWDECVVGAAARIDRCVLVSGSHIEPGVSESGTICHGGVRAVIGRDFGS